MRAHLRSAAAAAVTLSAAAAPRAAPARIPGIPGFGPMIVLDPSNLARNTAQLARQDAA